MIKTGTNKKCSFCGQENHYPLWQIRANKTERFYCSRDHRYKGQIGVSLSEETKKKMSEASKGVLKTGGVYTARGYMFVLSPEHPHKSSTGYVRKHRLVMEEHLGRFLNTGEVIHHVNENKMDNRIENLRLFNSHSEHMKMHKNALKN